MKQCQDRVKHTKVKVEDGNRKAVFLNPKKEVFVRTDFDGCVVSNNTAADWIVTKPGFGDLIVELKGRDVEHATKQVMSTAQYLAQNQLRTGKLAALIVCKQYPKERTATQRLQLAFAKQYKSPLHVQTGEREYRFEALFAN